MPMSPRLLRPRQAGGFDPRAISGLGLWLDASNDSSLTFNGSTVSEWRDLSGNGRHFSQSTASAQPNGTARTQNGLRVLDFATAQSLAGNAASQTIFRNVGGATLCGVVKNDATSGDSANAVFIAAHIQAATFQARATLVMDYAVGPRVAGRRLDSDSVAFVSAPPFSTNAMVLAGVIDYANSDVLITVNGGSPVVDTNFLTNGLTSDTSGEVTIGRTASFNGRLDGFVAELLMWPRALANDERQAVERYLGRKWGITVA